jgi:hypothetical protein
MTANDFIFVFVCMISRESRKMDYEKILCLLRYVLKSCVENRKLICLFSTQR